MDAGKKIVASEYPFSHKQKDKLNRLAQIHDYKVITIRLEADFDILWKRRYSRDRDDSRHLSYIMKNYHYGDTLGNRENVTNHITKKEFQQIVLDREYNSFELGRLFKVDVNDYTKVDYTSLLSELDKLIATSLCYEI